MEKPRSFRIPPTEQGQRLDRVLARAWPDLTRSRIQQLIKAGHVTRDGRTLKASEPVEDGDTIVAVVPERAPSELVPEQRPLSIVYEDEHILVVDKPAGLVVHPGAGVSRGTLVHALLAYDPAIARVGGGVRPGIVHRLDKDTSGLLLVARTEEARLALAADLAARRIHRRYAALVWRVPRPAEGTISLALGRDPKDRKRMAVRPEGAIGSRAAVSHYRVLAELPADWPRARFALLCVTLETGRTHQIRAHLSHHGHPVVGDSVYGGGAKKALSLPPEERRLAQQWVTGLTRQALHAAELAFRHPISGVGLELSAPLPEDIAQTLRALGHSTRFSCS